MSKYYQVDCERTYQYGYRCIEIKWQGVETVAKRGTLMAKVWCLDMGLYAIDDQEVYCYDLGGAVDIYLEGLAKDICKRHPRAKVTGNRISQNWTY